jgi:predicted secreted protein
MRHVLILMIAVLTLAGCRRDREETPGEVREPDASVKADVRGERGRGGARLNPGRVLQVRLRSATPGYAWRLASGAGEDARVTQTGTSREQTSRAGIHNTDTWDVYTFRTVRPGKATLVFEYGPAAAGSDQVSKQYVLDVEVTR